MNLLKIATPIALTLGIATAQAQSMTPQTQPPAQSAPSMAASDDSSMGARPGHVPGVGQSLPMSNAASNIDATDTRSTIAPTLPDAAIGDNAAPRAYVREARDDLAAGRTGQAQQDLEMAQTRMLDRVIPPGHDGGPSHNRTIDRINDARTALGNGDVQRATSIIDDTLRNWGPNQQAEN
jgi:hypothetical protein